MTIVPRSELQSTCNKLHFSVGLVAAADPAAATAGVAIIAVDFVVGCAFMYSEYNVLM